MNNWSANIARSAMLLGLAAMGTASETAAGDIGAADGQMLPDPPDVYSINNPGPPSDTTIAEQSIPTGRGVVRVSAEVSDAADNSVASDAVPLETLQGPNGQEARVRPGAEPDPAARAVAAAPPLGAYAVRMGSAKALVLPNDMTAPGIAATPFRVEPDMRVVDLPPGAVAPAGMPEPMTLYRVTDALPASPSAAGADTGTADSTAP